MNQITNEPYMMTVRQVAKAGLLSEYALRKLLREDKLPAIYIDLFKTFSIMPNFFNAIIIT